MFDNNRELKPTGRDQLDYCVSGLISKKFSRLDALPGWSMRMTILYHFLTFLLLPAASVVAAASDANAPRQYIDDETGATVFFVGRPLVFAHERPTFGADLPQSSSAIPNMPVPPRDYVTLAAAAVDRGGQYAYVLIGYFWSVGAPPQVDNACFGRGDLVLQLGDRRIKLTPFRGSARDAGISQSIHRPSSDAKPAVYSSDLATLGLIAESARPILYCGAETAPLKYELLEDRLPALRELVRRLSD